MSRSLIRAIFLLLAFVIFIFCLLQFPQITLKKQFTYGDFEIYGKQTISRTRSFEEILDSVSKIISHSTIPSKDLTYKVFLAHDTFYEKLLKLIGQNAFAFTFKFGQVYLAELDLSNGLFARNNNEYEIRNAIQLIAHESIHTQQHNFFKKRMPPWLAEGYAEYISYRPIRELNKYDLSTVVKNLEENPDEYWLKSEYGFWDLREYKYYRTIMEYMLDEKGHDYLDLVRAPPVQHLDIYLELKNHLKM